MRAIEFDETQGGGVERKDVADLFKNIGSGAPGEVHRYRKKTLVRAFALGVGCEIMTREGIVRADKGDYLVANESDLEWPWPVKKEIFEKTYEKVTP